MAVTARMRRLVKRPRAWGDVLGWILDNSTCATMGMALVSFGIIAYLELDVCSARFVRDYNGVQPIDLNLGKTYPPLVFGYLSQYGPEGRRLYLEEFVPLDTAFPFLGACFFAFSMGFAIRRGVGEKRLLWVPIASWLLDWLENCFFVHFTRVYPEEPTDLAWLGYAVSLSKITTLGLSFVLTAMLWVGLLLGPHSAQLPSSIEIPLATMSHGEAMFTQLDGDY